MPESSENPPSEVHSVPVAESFQRHPDFWFSDGSVVLIVENTGFRIHQSVLARKSIVFNDLFGIPQPLNPEMIDGCPFVHLSDSADDIVEILKILYFSLRYQAEEHPPWATVRAMYRIGKKYQIDEYTATAVGSIEKAFPTDIETWDKVQARSFPFMTFYRTDNISVANFARSNPELPSQIRWQALYQCCQLPSSALVEGVVAPDGTREVLDAEDLRRCLCGRKSLLQRDMVQLIDSMFVDTTECTEECTAAQTAFNAKGIAGPIKREWCRWNPLNSFGDVVSRDCSAAGMCGSCTAHRLKLFNDGRQDTLSSLESYFELD